MQEYSEPTTIGLTASTKEKLKRLKDEGYFHEMQDGYKFAVGLALQSHAIELSMKKVETIFNIGTLDQDKDLYEAVKTLRQDCEEPVYKTVERLAEWGVKELYEQSRNDDIDFSELLCPTKEPTDE